MRVGAQAWVCDGQIVGWTIHSSLDNAKEEIHKEARRCHELHKENNPYLLLGETTGLLEPRGPLHKCEMADHLSEEEKEEYGQDITMLLLREGWIWTAETEPRWLKSRSTTYS